MTNKADFITDTIKPCVLCYSNGNCKRLNKAIEVSETIKEKAPSLYLELSEINCKNFKKN